LSVGLGSGFRGSVSAAFGCTLGILPAAIASIIGLAALLHTSVMAFQIIKYLGVLYLFYMAWNIAREGGAMDMAEGRTDNGWLQIVIKAVLINSLNPKLSLFFMAFLPQFVPVTISNPTPTLTLLAAVFMTITFVVFVIYGAFAAMAREYVISRPQVLKWLQYGFAGTFGYLGVRLALSDR
jgi:threonine/homoserine/homoserine lactone efflux protein